MQHKNFIGVDAKNIYLIKHILKDDNDDKSITYPKPSTISFTEGTAVGVFEKNNIPKEYQKMFMVVNNNLSMAFQKLISHNINLHPASHKLNRFKAREFGLGTELCVAYNSSYELSGKQVGSPYAFDFDHCYISDSEEVKSFIIELREKELFDNYIKSISEITHIMFESEFDLNKGQSKKLVK